MAYTTIVHVSKLGVERMMIRTYYCNIAFVNQALYDMAVSFGFDKEVWENRNKNNKVIIMEDREKTIGEKRVRVDFNVTSNDVVTDIKISGAKMIDLCEGMKPQGYEKVEVEKLRLIAMAQTAYEEATMWAVKAATY